MGKHLHRISSPDLEAGTGTCPTCGVVKFRMKKLNGKYYPRCPVQLDKERRNKGNRLRSDGYRVLSNGQREHRTIMEQILGRYLWPDENVHHINGQRADNRPENLELWVKPQPSGVRVEDAVSWAQEILRRYT